MLTANTSQSSTEPDRVAVVKPYFVSPQEWKVGVLILAFVACLRVALIWNEFSSKEVPWTESFQLSETKEAVVSELQNYCRIDARILCQEYFPRHCPRLQNNIGPSLTLIWGIDCNIDKIFARLTHQLNWSNITICYGEIETELSTKGVHNNSGSIKKTLTDPETKLVLQLFLYTIAGLFKRIIFEDFFQISFPLEVNRLIRHYFMAILDLFDKNSKTTMTTNDAIKQVWTKGELFVLMRYAIKFAQDPEVNSVILERFESIPLIPRRKIVAIGESFNHIFLPRVTQVVAELEEKYGDSDNPVGIQSTINTYTQNLTMTQQLQPLFPSDDQNTCMYKYYYATDNNDDSDGLITQQCRSGMKDGSEIFPYLPTELEYDTCQDAFVVACTVLGPIFIIMILALWRLSHCKESHKSSADKRRQQLQQELEDPHLRSVLERRFPADKRKEAIAKVEEIVANWDSKAIAVRRVRVQVQRFRKFLLLLTVGWLFGLYWMRQKYSKCVFGLYLDIMFVCVVTFVASYSIPMNLEEEETPNDVGAVEMSDHQPLLGEENTSYSSTAMSTRSQ